MSFSAERPATLHVNCQPLAVVRVGRAKHVPINIGTDATTWALVLNGEYAGQWMTPGTYVETNESPVFMEAYTPGRKRYTGDVAHVIACELELAARGVKYRFPLTDKERDSIDQAGARTIADERMELEYTPTPTKPKRKA